MICIICLNHPTNLASIDSCHHEFCYDCIVKWKMTNNLKCPLCRNIFSRIYLSNKRVLRSNTRCMRVEELNKKIRKLADKITDNSKCNEYKIKHTNKLFKLLYNNIWFFYNKNKNSTNKLLKSIVNDTIDIMEKNQNFDFKEGRIWLWKFKDKLNIK
jgi:hypothetical protein